MLRRMKRREAIFLGGAALALAGAEKTRAESTPLQSGIPVAFVVGTPGNLIDLAGPYEVFSDARIKAGGTLPANA